MPSFEKEFIESEGQSFEYNGNTIIGIDRLRVEKKFSGQLELVSTNSDWKQGVKMKVNGEMVINNVCGKNFVIWQNNMHEPIQFSGRSKDQQLLIWNAWDTGNGVTNYWHNGAAMIKETDGDAIIYRCNDGHPDDNFDDIVFKIVIDTE